MKTEDIKNIARAWQQVQEKLKGGQKKLDMDKDGDIDAKDFAHMRNKKKTNEDEVVMNPKKDKKEKKDANSEVSQDMAAEAKLDELSPETLNRYKKKSMDDESERTVKHNDAVLGLAGKKPSMSDTLKTKRKINNREKGRKLANKKLGFDNNLYHNGKKLTDESVEQNEGVMDKVHDIRRKVFGKSDAEKRAEAERSAMSGFHKAMGKAADHAPSAMGAAIKKKKNESVEQVDEISKDKVGRYLKKAMVSTADAGMDTASQDKDIRKRGINTFVKRRMGASDAVRKLTGKARVAATEGVEEMTDWPIYKRLMEKDAHTKGATAPEEIDSKASGKEKEFRAKHKTDTVDNPEASGGDIAKATNAAPSKKARPGDNPQSDKMEKPADTTKG